ncbi:sugar-binding domain-containing protein [Anaerococcus urinomassiliensis]|uniref:sugar-binding domain-containing protein n=1 Tax=Anaerococcus urinomassiliensis TaxID=1745712 RepID=UPI000938D0AB|nr:sugar-binding domain-containing protein [Anaerococcus urinomassiliensis]
MKKTSVKLLAILTSLGLLAPGFARPVFAKNENVIISDVEKYYVSDYSGKREQNFNDNWKFALGEQLNAQNVNFNDASWTNVDLPHDYSLIQDYSTSAEAESGYKPGGIGWYRKSFNIPSLEEAKRYFINFDAVYMNSTTYINGHKLGDHPYGYTPFSYDLTPYLKQGENIIAVRVDNDIPTSRWYSGSGISRTVTLVTTNDLHIGHNGIKIETPKLADEYAGNVTMDIKTKLENQSDHERVVTLEHRLLDTDGNVVGESTKESIKISAKSSIEDEQGLIASNIKLWDVDNPNLYKIESKIIENGEDVDLVDTDYGFRWIETSKDRGFFLNGENIKLKGVCMHHDQGALGARQYYRAIERQVEILKDMGVNLIRVTHNPASKELIDIANKHGMLLIDEAFDGWVMAKNLNKNDYSKYFENQIGENEMLATKPDMTWAEYDIKAMVARDMNSPSVVMYSMGNEVIEGTARIRRSEYPAIMQNLVKWAKEVDPTRFVTMGDNQLKDGLAGDIVDQANIITDAGGIVGLNYAGGNRYDTIHSSYPNWTLFGSETASSVNSRGVYTRTGSFNYSPETPSDKLLTSYDNSRVGWGALAAEAWYDVITRDFVMGEAVWTGFDYLGEPTPWNGITPGAQGSWPSSKSSYFGIIDTAGLAKDSYYFYQSQWNDKVDTLHILPAWNKDAVSGDKNVPIVVYTNLDKVELYFTPENGEKRLIGRQEFVEKHTPGGFTYKTVDGKDDFKALYGEFNLDYEDGLLEAVGYRGDEIVSDTVGRNKVETTGEFTNINLSADRETIKADNNDLSYITIDLIDDKGNIVPTANDNVSVNVDGNGILMGLDNGHQADHQPYDSGNRNALAGRLVAIVKSTHDQGPINITASSGDISKTITINSQASDDDSDYQGVVYYNLSKNYMVKQGSSLNLPETIPAIMADGSEVSAKVNWQEIDPSVFDRPASYEIKGLTEYNDEISVKLTVVEEISALLNHSTSSLVGVIPDLAKSRLAINNKGQIIDQAFNVQWEDITQEEVSRPGILIKKGKANIFGKTYNLTSSIRITDPTVKLGANIAKDTIRMTHDLEEDKNSGKLEALVDGKIDIKAPTDENVWTNIKNFESGKKDANLIFEYATQQVIGQIDLYFAQNSQYKGAEKLGVYMSETGAKDSYKEVNAKTEISEQSDGILKYNLTFNPTQATFIKIGLRNDENPMAVSELEIRQASSSKESYESTEFESLIIDDYELTKEEMNADEYLSHSKSPDIEIKTKENASYTLVDVDQLTKVIILESENGQNRRTFTIKIDPVDKSSLEKSINQANKYLRMNGYTKDSKGKLKNAIDEAKKVINNQNASQKEVNGAKTNLARAVFSLRKDGVVDKGNLETLVKTNKEIFSKLNTVNYTEESVKNYSNAITEAENVLRDNSPSKNQVENAISNLKDASTKLETKKNKLNISKLEKLINNIEKNSKLKEKLADDVKEAKKVIEDAKIQEEIDNAYKKLLRKYFKV